MSDDLRWCPECGIITKAERCEVNGAGSDTIPVHAAVAEELSRLGDAINWDDGTFFRVGRIAIGRTDNGSHPWFVKEFDDGAWAGTSYHASLAASSSTAIRRLLRLPERLPRRLNPWLRRARR